MDNSFYFLSPDAKCRECNKFPTEEEAIKLALEAAIAQKMPIKVLFYHNGFASVHVVCLPNGQVKKIDADNIDIIEHALAEVAFELKELDPTLAAECINLVESSKAIKEIAKDDTASKWENFGDVNYKFSGGIFIKRHGDLKVGNNKGILWEIIETHEPMHPYEDESEKEMWMVSKRNVSADEIWNEGNPVLGLTEDAQLVGNFGGWNSTKDPLSWLLTSWIPYFGSNPDSRFVDEKEIDQLFEHLGFRSHEKAKEAEAQTKFYGVFVKTMEDIGDVENGPMITEDIDFVKDFGTLEEAKKHILNQKDPSNFIIIENDPSKHEMENQDSWDYDVNKKIWNKFPEETKAQEKDSSEEESEAAAKAAAKAAAEDEKTRLEKEETDKKEAHMASIAKILNDNDGETLSVFGDKGLNKYYYKAEALFDSRLGDKDTSKILADIKKIFASAEICLGQEISEDNRKIKLLANIII